MKRIFTFGLLVAAAFALTNCAQKESYVPVQEEATKYVNFEIVVKLPAETKTYNDGMSTKWSDDDQIGLIARYYENQSDVWYKPNYVFVSDPLDNPFVHQGNGKFLGKLEQELWNATIGSIANLIPNAQKSGFTAVYPYGSDGAVPASTVQNGYDSMAHLAGANCPLAAEIDLSWTQDYGSMWSDERPYTLPEVILEHVTSVIEVAVTNNTAAAVNVNEVDFLVDGAVKATTVVENAGALAAGETAMVYIVVEPGTYSNLSFTVNGTFVKSINAAEATFTAGLIKKVNFVLE